MTSFIRIPSDLLWMGFAFDFNFLAQIREQLVGIRIGNQHKLLHNFKNEMIHIQVVGKDLTRWRYSRSGSSAAAADFRFCAKRAINPVLHDTNLAAFVFIGFRPPHSSLDPFPRPSSWLQQFKVVSLYAFVFVEVSKCLILHPSNDSLLTSFDSGMRNWFNGKPE